MEVFFLTRGKSDEVEEWAKWMSTRHLPLPVKKGDNSVENALMECQLRPIQLWGFAFPRESRDLVLNSLNLPSENPFFHTSEGKPEININGKLWLLRKLLGADKIPVPKKEAGILFMPYNRIRNINFIGIGIKDDKDVSEATHERI